MEKKNFNKNFNRLVGRLMLHLYAEHGWKCKPISHNVMEITINGKKFLYDVDVYKNTVSLSAL